MAPDCIHKEKLRSERLKSLGQALKKSEAALCAGRDLLIASLTIRTGAAMAYRVGRFTLEPHKQLLDGAVRVPLGRKALDLLSVLARSEGAIVSKDELMEAVWPGVIVEENAIQVHMAAVRRALGDVGDAIVTVRGVGYQLGALAPALEASPRTVPSEPLIAVLAFENRSNDPELAYFAEGVSEEILNAVARIDGVGAIARTSSFQIQGDDRRVSAVAAALGVTHILDGSVRREGDRLRIGAQLADAKSETVLWSERFEGKAGDVFAFQDAIAGAVATALRRKIGRPVQRPPMDPRAYDLYLQGRRLAGVEAARPEANAALEASLAIEPEFADAWASLALSLAVSAKWDSSPARADLRQRATEATNRAFALNPDCAVAYLALDMLEPLAHYKVHDDYTSKAVTLNPDSPEALHVRSFNLYSVGRTAEAFDCSERAWRIDPLNPLSVENYANLLFETGHKAKSYETYALGRERWPEVWWMRMEPVLHASFAGDWPKVDCLLAEPGVDRPEIEIARRTASALRQPSGAVRQAALADAEKRLAEVGRAEASRLVFLFALGLVEEGFGLIERSDYSDFFEAEGSPKDMIGFHPGIIFSVANIRMREDPRFLRLCGKLGLCGYWAETGRWPDCADELPYDFRAEAKRVLDRR